MTSPYRYYLDVISQWPTAIVSESQWFTWFDLPSVGALKADLATTVRNVDSGADNTWDIPKGIVDNLIKSEYQLATENLIGCVFARQVTLPGESITAGNDGLDYSGYRAPAITSGRQSYKKLQIYFVETNSSFIDLVIRPWIILVGYYGFIARSNPTNNPRSVKCNSLDVVYLGKTGAYSPSIKRKIVRFYGIAPVSVNGLSNTYASDGMQFTSVDFTYDSYSVLAPDYIIE